ncbi:MAG: FixH family protein [Gammaproteobacteria bacterium]|nr:FixH family protein [Gammaproteobacteria bacterium]
MISVPQRWYRVPQVWLVLGLPAAVVIGCAITMVIAWRTFDGVVVDDYYRRGLEINQDLVRDRRAAELGLDAVVAFAPDSGLTISITAADTTPLPDTLQVRLLHATRSGQDQALLLPWTEAGRYRAPAPELASGRWYLHIEAADWRLRNTLSIP